MAKTSGTEYATHRSFGKRYLRACRNGASGWAPGSDPLAVCEGCCLAVSEASCYSKQSLYQRRLFLHVRRCDLRDRFRAYLCRRRLWSSCCVYLGVILSSFVVEVLCISS